jgi:hypothetical protein
LRERIREKDLPSGVSPKRPEEALNPEDFNAVFGVSKEAFVALPNWRKLELRKAGCLF